MDPNGPLSPKFVAAAWQSIIAYLVSSSLLFSQRREANQQPKDFQYRLTMGILTVYLDKCTNLKNDDNIGCGKVRSIIANRVSGGQSNEILIPAQCCHCNENSNVCIGASHRIIWNGYIDPNVHIAASHWIIWNDNTLFPTSALLYLTMIILPFNNSFTTERSLREVWAWTE